MESKQNKIELDRFDSENWDTIEEIDGEEIESEPRPSTCEARLFYRHYRVPETRS